ncbi:hypothetical protein ACFWOL_20020 [Streptomyces sp. NPDC058442]|uniref:hypothetical protein n=1 Tax=Streptomyces sp. NPDC058442 TaxID=3346503 RepID=UPI00366A3A04
MFKDLAARADRPGVLAQQRQQLELLRGRRDLRPAHPHLSRTTVDDQRAGDVPGCGKGFGRRRRARGPETEQQWAGAAPTVVPGVVPVRRETARMRATGSRRLNGFAR